MANFFIATLFIKAGVSFEIDSYQTNVEGVKLFCCIPKEIG